MTDEGIVILVMGCVGILLVGWLLTPSGERQPTSPPGAGGILDVGAVGDPFGPNGRGAAAFRDLREVGRNALQYCVAFPAAGSRPRMFVSADFCAARNDEPATSGMGLVVSSEGDVLTCIEALDANRAPVAIMPDGTRVSGVIRAYEPETGLTLVRLKGHEGLAAAAIAAVAAEPGELAVAAGHADRDFVLPVSIACRDQVSYGIGGGGGILVPGLPIFNVAGQALGISTSDPLWSSAFSAKDALARLEALAAQRGALPASLGVLLQDLNPALEARFGRGGALVSELVEGGPAAAAGLRPGDVLVRVAGNEVDGVAACVRLISALPVEGRVEVVARRAGREESRSVEPVAVFDRPPSGRTARPPAEAPLAETLFSRASLVEAQVPEDGVVLMIEGTEVLSALAADRLLRRHRPPWLTYLAGGRGRFFAVLTPERHSQTAHLA